MTKFDLNSSKFTGPYQPMTSWDPAQAGKKLNQLYQESLCTAEKTIQWYLRYRKKKGNTAKFIRFTSILLLVASTLIPLFTAWYEKTELLYLGYILASMGGGLLLIDRYYGYSTSWIRFVLTGKDLEQLKRAFVKNYQLSCIRHSPMSRDGFAAVIGVILLFEQAFSETVKVETAQWAREFEQNMKDLIAALQAQGDKLHEELQRSQANAGTDKNRPVTAIATPEVIKEAYEKKFTEWSQTFEVEGIGFGQKQTGGQLQPVDCLVFFPLEKKISRDRVFTPIPPSIRFRSIDGQSYDIPTDVRPLGKAISATSANPDCDAATAKRPGCSVSRADNKETGTIGLKVYGQGRAYLLSCYHVLCPREFSVGIETFTAATSIEDNSVFSPGSLDTKAASAIASVYNGFINGELDCAIATLKDEASLIDSICKIGQPPAMPLEISAGDAEAQLAVRSVGRTSGLIKGNIQLSSGKFIINYSVCGRDIRKEISGLIVSSQRSQSGDSGAMVVDEHQNVIGIIIANSATYTYILPIYRILSALSISLKPN